MEVIEERQRISKREEEGSFHHYEDVTYYKRLGTIRKGRPERKDRVGVLLEII